jgi:hypothetical protein
MTQLVADITLDYWADLFVETGIADVMTFEAFMTLAPALRERRNAQIALSRHEQHRVDRGLPDAALHDNRLIDPMHHGPRLNRYPLYFRRRRHV